MLLGRDCSYPVALVNVCGSGYLVASGDLGGELAWLDAAVGEEGMWGLMASVVGVPV
jgi:hypothetical protein